jgi:hypothetical protein
MLQSFAKMVGYRIPVGVAAFYLVAFAVSVYVGWKVGRALFGF